MKVTICPRCGGAGLLPEITELKRVRLAAGVSQGEVARRLKISQGYLSRIESGEAPCPAWVSHLYRDLEVSAAHAAGHNGAGRAGL